MRRLCQSFVIYYSIAKFFWAISPGFLAECCFLAHFHAVTAGFRESQPF